jgi:hypothetical protein
MNIKPITTVFQIIIPDHSKRIGSIFDSLHNTGLYIKDYYIMSFISYGEGYYHIYFDGTVSQIVEQTINRLINKKFGTKLIRL